MTKKQLQGRTRKELAEMARDRGIGGWSRMRKHELVEVLSKTGAKAPEVRTQRSAASRTDSEEERVESAKFDVGVATKDLSSALPADLPSGYGKDRIVLLVRDPYWLHAYWEITAKAIRQAEAALGHEWHGARPILRLLDVTHPDTSTGAETIVRDIEIHGDTRNWYIEVQNPPRSYRVDIGYLSPSGHFVAIARSNVVTTPRPGVSEIVDEDWKDLDALMAERIYAMSTGLDPSTSSLELKELFEERLRRPWGSYAISSFGSGAMAGMKPRGFWFKLDAELIVYGATEPGSKVTLQGKPITLRPDGTFTVRFSLPDNRQIIPAVAQSPDGLEERTIILAVERNTKHLEPLTHDMVLE